MPPAGSDGTAAGATAAFANSGLATTALALARLPPEVTVTSISRSFVGGRLLVKTMNFCEGCHIPGAINFENSASEAALPNRLYRTFATGAFNRNVGTSITSYNASCVASASAATDVSVHSLPPNEDPYSAIQSSTTVYRPSCTNLMNSRRISATSLSSFQDMTTSGVHVLNRAECPRITRAKVSANYPGCTARPANKRLDRFTLRGRRKVDGQWKLYGLVHNIEKLANHRSRMAA